MFAYDLVLLMKRVDGFSALKKRGEVRGWAVDTVFKLVAATAGTCLRKGEDL